MNAVTPIFAPEPPEPDLLAPLGDIDFHLHQHIHLLTGIDSLIQTEIIDLAISTGGSLYDGPIDRLTSILSIHKRGLEAARDQLETAHTNLVSHRFDAQSSVGRHLQAKDWLQPHPRLAAMIRKWSGALAAYSDAAARVAAASGDDETDRASEEASTALAMLVATPSPGLRAFREKVAIVVSEGTMGNVDIPQMILDDLDRITVATENEPWLVQADSPTEPCDCPADASATVEA